MTTSPSLIVFHGTFIHLPRLPAEPATPSTPPKHVLEIRRGALWVRTVDGRIEGFEWGVEGEEELGALMGRMGWREEGRQGDNDDDDNDTEGVRVRIVRGRKGRNGFFFPGFVDTHIHAPQYPNSGIFGSSTLLDWLKTYTFPLESSFSSSPSSPTTPPPIAHNVYNRVVRRTLAHGTTCAAYFATIHVPATNLLADICHTRGQRALIGRVCMDNPSTCPDHYIDSSPSSSLAATRATIAHITTLDPSHTLLKPIITPRFAPSCTPPLLSSLGALAAETSPPTHIQTHISENTSEVSLVARLFPSHDSYTHVYDSAGLLTRRTVLAHAIHLSASEREIIASRGAGVAHCPVSNSAIGSGLCEVRELLDSGISVGLGTDVSGGYSSSLMEVVRQTCLVSRLVAYRAHEEGGGKGSVEGGADRRKISVEEALWLATRGGAKVLDMEGEIGGFEKGMWWDAMYVELTGEEDEGEQEEGGRLGNVEVFGWESREEWIAKWVWCGDDRNVKAVWVGGRIVHGRVERDL
ncbi:guanine deaminase [Polytolypa hystricis UAMH7299]|uniref:Probable guanine deaminase n=1 Tax=Polytolypa hystricis (strain UAMH7299) TaxID=1447883 RepID=A0A2B7YQX7_POLH7|nr:guanine deaminase [Polytolypa hystricis UAMH7299]